MDDDYDGRQMRIKKREKIVATSLLLCCEFEPMNKVHHQDNGFQSEKKKN